MDQPVSATVLLRPAAGGTHEGVTAATAERSLPDPEAAARAGTFFRGAGFDITAAYGPSFSLVGPRDLFERTFGVELEEHAQRGLQTAQGTYELPLDRLPARVTDSVQAVTFTPPPDFGPTDFS